MQRRLETWLEKKTAELRSSTERKRAEVARAALAKGSNWRARFARWWLRRYPAERR
jgi:hypothetical protein